MSTHKITEDAKMTLTSDFEPPPSAASTKTYEKSLFFNTFAIKMAVVAGNSPSPF